VADTDSMDAQEPRRQTHMSENTHPPKDEKREDDNLGWKVVKNLRRILFLWFLVGALTSVGAYIDKHQLHSSDADGSQMVAGVILLVVLSTYFISKIDEMILRRKSGRRR
jgi:hypothetical protein